MGRLTENAPRIWPLRGAKYRGVDKKGGRSGGYNNILVIRLRAYGDTLLTTPLLRGLKQAYPEARLSILLEPAMAEVVAGLPYVDEVVPFDRLGFKARG